MSKTLPALIENKKIAPPPTKAQVRLAMAAAIVQQKTKERDAALKVKEDLLAEWQKDALAAVLAEPDYKDVDGGRWGSVTVKVSLRKESKRLAPLVARKIKIDEIQIPRVPEFKVVVSELLSAEQATGNDAVNAMLADEDVRKALLKAGTKLLAAAENRNAITA